MTESATLLIDSRCELAEGPIWHPMRQELFWFDILGKTLHSANDAGEMLRSWPMPGFTSAAAVVDGDTLVVASEGAFRRVDLASGSSSSLASLEPDKPGNRPNDGRVHPSGTFWIGTISKKGGSDVGAGAVYALRSGLVEKVLGEVTIPNSICFSPDGRTGYFADSETKRILKCPVDAATGLPVGEWTLFADVSGHRGVPDGSVVDSEGYLWNARFNGHCVVRHAPDGSVDRVIEVPAGRVTCPAFGGSDFRTLFITTAREGASREELSAEPWAGGIFSVRVDVAGQPEPRLKL